MGFFESRSFRTRPKRLFGDLPAAHKLGGGYGKFDGEGKKWFIERMKNADASLTGVFHEHLSSALRGFSRPSLTVSSCAPSSSQFAIDTRADVQPDEPKNPNADGKRELGAEG